MDTNTNQQQFEQIWKSGSGGLLTIWVRNFMKITDPEMRLAPSIRLSIGDQDYYLEYAFLDPFLSTKLWNELVERQTNGLRGFLTAHDLILKGPQIAKETGRTIRIWHQYGSGDPDQADFDEYGPFYPDGPLASGNTDVLLGQFEQRDDGVDFWLNPNTWEWE